MLSILDTYIVDLVHVLCTNTNCSTCVTRSIYSRYQPWMALLWYQRSHLWQDREFVYGRRVWSSGRYLTGGHTVLSCLVAFDAQWPVSRAGLLSANKIYRVLLLHVWTHQRVSALLFFNRSLCERSGARFISSPLCRDWPTGACSCSPRQVAPKPLCRAATLRDFTSGCTRTRSSSSRCLSRKHCFWYKKKCACFDFFSFNFLVLIFFKCPCFVRRLARAQLRCLPCKSITTSIMALFKTNKSARSLRHLRLFLF